MTAIGKYDPSEEEMAFAMSSIPFSKPERQTNAHISKYEASDEELDFAQGALSEPVQEELPWYKSYLSAAKKGITQGIVGAGEFIGQLAKEDPFGESGKSVSQTFGVDISSPELKKFKEESFKPVPEEEKQKLKEELDVRYPSNEGFVEGAIERGGKILPTALISGGGFLSNVIRTGIAGVSGEAAKEAGFGELGQNITEMGAFVAPNPTRLIQASNQNQQRLLEFGRRMGMTEEQLAPTMNSESWIKRQLAQISTRRGRTQAALRDTQEGLNNVYEGMRATPEAQQIFSRQETGNLAANIRNSLHTLDNALDQEVMPDINILFNRPVNGEEVMTLYHKINRIASRLPEADARQFGRLQESLRNGITAVSPELGLDFSLANELYTNYARLRTRLQPNLTSDLLSGAKAIGAMASIITGNYPHLAGLTSAIAARKVASEMLINPRLQNIQHKMIRALNENRIPVANKLIEQFREEIKDVSPEFYGELEGAQFPDKKEKYIKVSLPTKNQEKKAK